MVTDGSCVSLQSFSLESCPSKLLSGSRSESHPFRTSFVQAWRGDSGFHEGSQCRTDQTTWTMEITRVGKEIHSAGASSAAVALGSDCTGGSSLAVCSLSRPVLGLPPTVCTESTSTPTFCGSFPLASDWICCRVVRVSLPLSTPRLCVVSRLHSSSRHSSTAWRVACLVPLSPLLPSAASLFLPVLPLLPSPSRVLSLALSSSGTLPLSVCGLVASVVVSYKVLIDSHFSMLVT